MKTTPEHNERIAKTNEQHSDYEKTDHNFNHSLFHF